MIILTLHITMFVKLMKAKLTAGRALSGIQCLLQVIELHHKLSNFNVGDHFQKPYFFHIFILSIHLR